MPGSTNIQQWNPGKINQENDAAYTADPQRTGGAISGVFGSQLANKLFYQVSTVNAALAKMMANKGYTISDADFTNLVGALNNILTFVDVPTIFNNAALTGNPTAPTPPDGDNDTSIATTAFINRLLGAFSGFEFVHVGTTGHIKFPAIFGGFIIQWFAGSPDTTSGETSATKFFPLPFPVECLNVQLTMQQSNGPAADCWYQLISFSPTSVTIFKQGTGAALPTTVAYILAVGH